MQKIRHIGVILDGNRRYAKSKEMAPLKGHEEGAKKIKDFLKWCDELGIEEITMYALSIQNLNRTKEEVAYLFNLFEEFNKELLKEKNIEEMKKKGVKIRFIGRRTLLPTKLQDSMKEIEEKINNDGNKTINFAIAYGGREEITDSVKKIAEKIKNNELAIEDIDEKLIGEMLYINSEPELIIRTGGTTRTSNFLIWQSHYSEWFFLEKFWPEIEKEDLIKIIDKFQKIERRFGK